MLKGVEISDQCI